MFVITEHPASDVITIDNRLLPSQILKHPISTFPHIYIVSDAGEAWVETDLTPTVPPWPLLGMSSTNSRMTPIIVSRSLLVSWSLKSNPETLFIQQRTVTLSTEGTASR
jgi:hypothetical protein